MADTAATRNIICGQRTMCCGKRLRGWWVRGGRKAFADPLLSLIDGDRQ